MTKQIGWVLASGLLVAGLGSASAADMAVKARPVAPIVSVYNWTGFYVGVNAGGGFGRTNASETGIPENLLTASANYGLNHDLTGGFGGVQAGYNWQVQNWIWGIEADIQAADIKGTGTLTGVGVAQRNGVNAFPTNFVTASEKIDYFGTVRLRAGFLATPALLLYGTGGLAYAEVKTSGQFHFAAPVDYFASGSRIQVGWTVGAGAEYKVSSNWSVKGEYLYYDLGHTSDISNFGIPAVPPFQSRFDYNVRGSLARIGLNYQWFAGPVVAKY
ncbi:MAG: outer membrane protein [Bradyrhizobium sp.]